MEAPDRKGEGRRAVPARPGPIGREQKRNECVRRGSQSRDSANRSPALADELFQGVLGAEWEG